MNPFFVFGCIGTGLVFDQTNKLISKTLLNPKEVVKSGKRCRDLIKIGDTTSGWYVEDLIFHK